MMMGLLWVKSFLIAALFGFSCVLFVVFSRSLLFDVSSGGRVMIDIRTYSESIPTKKGIGLSFELFQSLEKQFDNICKAAQPFIERQRQRNNKDTQIKTATQQRN